MAKPHDIRRLAFQVLFQLDARDGADIDDARTMAGDHAVELGLRAVDAGKATELALAAYETRREADRLIRELAPSWPAHRQPAPDRAIIRLAVYEIASGRVEPKVAIDEAVELAKEFGTERSPAFVNAVLDAVLKGTPETPAAPEGEG